MNESEKSRSSKDLPSGKRKQQLITSADKIINQIVKDTSNLLDAQIFAEIVSIGIRDIVDSGIIRGKLDRSIQLTKEQKDKLLVNDWACEKSSYDGYFDASGHPLD